MAVALGKALKVVAAKRFLSCPKKHLASGYCGSSHLKMKCPAYGKKCASCGKLNHFVKKCRVASASQEEARSVALVEQYSSDEELFVGSVQVGVKGVAAAHSSWEEHLRVNDTWIRFHIDTVSQANIPA